MKNPKKFVDIDCTAMVEPLYKQRGFDSFEEEVSFLYKMANHKKGFLFQKLLDEFGGKLLGDVDGPYSVSALYVKNRVKEISDEWLAQKVEEFKGTKQINVFVGDFPFPFDGEFVLSLGGDSIKVLIK